MIQIQLYNGVKDNKGKPVDIQKIINIISGKEKDTALIKKITELRDLNNFFIKSEIALQTTEKGNDGFKVYVDGFKPQYDKLKQSLQAVTWSGLFSKRNAASLTDYSFLICLDIDKLNDEGQYNSIWFALTTCPYVFILFRSPSGKGIKVIFKIDAEPWQHKETFLSIEKYFLENYKVVIDASGKDVNRLCFLSYDENLFLNENSDIWHIPEVEIIEPAPQPTLTPAQQSKLSIVTKKEITQLQTSGQTLNDIFESTQKVIEFSAGNRNNFIFKFACNCNRVGISDTECLNFSYSIASDKKPDEVKATVNSAYKANFNEHGKYKKSDKPKGGTFTVINTKDEQGFENATPPNEYIKKGSKKQTVTEPDYKFWIEHKTKKGKGKNAYEQIRYELRRVDFCKFLFSQGLHLYSTGKNEGFQIVHSANGIIKPLTPQQVKHFALDWCKKYDLEEVEEMLRKGQKNYFAMNELDSLPYKEIEIAKDTEHESYFYFKNCIVAINDQGEVKELPYDKNSTKYIWESSKVDFEIKYTDPPLYYGLDEKGNATALSGTVLPYDKMPCDFAKFISLASWNPNNDEEKNFTAKIKTQRFDSLCSAIGFLLDGYKHPANRKGIFAVDHKIGEAGEQNGRTGKSIIPQACNLLKKAATINGKTFDPKYQFAYEPITIDSQIVNFNDMRQNFDPENIFEHIADDYSVNCRNTGFIHFKYKSSPKVYVSTNGIPKGQGGSYTGRMHIIEFSDYFNPTHTPYDEFGRSLFPEEDKEEMTRLINFLLFCVAYYKQFGLIDYPSGNYDSRKLTSEVNQVFLDFMDAETEVTRNIEYKKIDLLIAFNDKHYFPLENKKVTAHTFTKWVKHYCKTKGLKLNPHKNGGRDNRNSVEYYIIADANWQAIQTSLL